MLRLRELGWLRIAFSLAAVGASTAWASRIAEREAGYRVLGDGEARAVAGGAGPAGLGAIIIAPPPANNLVCQAAAGGTCPGNVVPNPEKECSIQPGGVCLASYCYSCDAVGAKYKQCVNLNKANCWDNWGSILSTSPCGYQSYVGCTTSIITVAKGFPPNVTLTSTVVCSCPGGYVTSYWASECGQDDCW